MADRRLCALLCLAIACTAPGPPRTTLEPTDDDGSRRVEAVHVALIERMLSHGQPYAALAHLDALDLAIPDAPPTDRAHATWLRAEALRQLGAHDDAVSLYGQLLDGPFAGLAYRGLGLVAAVQNRAAESRAHLETARGLRPTDARIRNDLGYAYLVAGDLRRASHELMTALELDDTVPSVTANVLLLLYAREDESAAREFARRRRIDAARQEIVRAEARRVVASFGARSEVEPDRRRGERE